jgi:hypothetical protein
VVPSVPCKRGRPLGSRNKKTMAALAAAAAADYAKAVAAAAGGSSGVAAGLARRPRLPPKKQPPAYASVNGYITFVVPILAGSKERLPLPFKFVEAMEGQGLTHAIVEECSGGQPSYHVEIFYGGWPKFF